MLPASIACLVTRRSGRLRRSMKLLSLPFTWLTINELFINITVITHLMNCSRWETFTYLVTCQVHGSCAAWAQNFVVVYHIILSSFYGHCSLQNCTMQNHTVHSHMQWLQISTHILTYLFTYLHFNFYDKYIKNHAERKENWMKDVNISTRKKTQSLCHEHEPLRHYLDQCHTCNFITQLCRATKSQVWHGVSRNFLTVEQVLFWIQQCSILCNFVGRMRWTLIGQFLFMWQSSSVQHAQLHTATLSRDTKLRDKIAGVTSVLEFTKCVAYKGIQLYTMQ